MTDSTKTAFPASVLEWLRAGYPEGVPPKDRFPLVALLRRAALTDAQVQEIVLELVSPANGALDDGAISTAEIATYIRDQIDAEPTAEDISRVSARLAAGGWPLADPAAL
ncbi:DUF3349 domain-containing protein [Rhodococcus sp. IEGM 1354]|jgi:hypothetical protein|uniref:DUF3349 domain-containing protein n=1 Tax=Rhodococcus sp. IEGM 1354 TaxID=3047088 RepID=UPI0024B6B572|nr:DUF3349 domain-containing protein [Rhodococcus sp. IEGM 1354]MDI9931677.1 DUF3349 domain-containing protein [Rhodococcus sp. IEGM 1354]